MTMNKITSEICIYLIPPVRDNITSDDSKSAVL